MEYSHPQRTVTDKIRVGQGTILDGQNSPLLVDYRLRDFVIQEWAGSAYADIMRGTDGVLVAESGEIVAGTHYTLTLESGERRDIIVKSVDGLRNLGGATIVGTGPYY